ncbi:Meiotically Up-regulated Gene 113 (MUG113) protein [Knoellia remsis]|uniref:Meiotically Up-regulated Gene 113 (MUG113) protein n=2 Tax=Knoellia remsis TaxID=407159 RepID=A0A2T0TU80_9MICO|nr:Meiotically Up-regulated Gene 113 (MUG113) protein [Knoellia remsis]
MLRAYNAEAENAVKSVKAGNLGSAQKRLSKAKEQIARQGALIELSVSEPYHRLRLQELELAARHLQAVARDRELERERRAELREQRILEQEIKKEKDRLDKERSHYLNSIARLRERGDTQAADALQAELDRVDQEIAAVDYRAANIRAGYVYVISNIGAFGAGVVKIGMTRRLEPMDRIRELGDASVPFVFDVHALFFSDDAVSIEAMLHREFAKERINKVNLRKEFFRVGPDAVLDALREHNVSVLEFDTHAAAEQYRMSWPEEQPVVEETHHRVVPHTPDN